MLAWSGVREMRRNELRTQVPSLQVWEAVRGANWGARKELGKRMIVGLP